MWSIWLSHIPNQAPEKAANSGGAISGPGLIIVMGSGGKGASVLKSALGLVSIVAQAFNGNISTTNINPIFFIFYLSF
jgi:hypothetical protein